MLNDSRMNYLGEMRRFVVCAMKNPGVPGSEVLLPLLQLLLAGQDIL